MTTIPECCHRPLLYTGVLSAVILVLSALILDFGDTLRVNTLAIFLFWGWVVVALYRRPTKLTAVDLWIMRRGLLPFVVGFFVMVQVGWRVRGFM